jgi:hypothetical protein
MAKRSIHVTPSGDGWAVRKPGSERASAVKDTQREAERAAKANVAREGGGTVYVHRRDGQVKGKFIVGASGEEASKAKKR